ncbi:MAG: hypothetical protein LWW95_11155 [Candidatus Desulfofervidus auxilii]|nr:hypothetical protein [Candidatus Desulfofervidus auxilii]
MNKVVVLRYTHFPHYYREYDDHFLMHIKDDFDFISNVVIRTNKEIDFDYENREYALRRGDITIEEFEEYDERIYVKVLKKRIEELGYKVTIYEDYLNPILIIHRENKYPILISFSPHDFEHLVFHFIYLNSNVNVRYLITQLKRYLDVFNSHITAGVLCGEREVVIDVLSLISFTREVESEEI